jgi:hypothetical protein
LGTVKLNYQGMKKDAVEFLEEYGEMLNDMKTKVSLMGRGGGEAYDHHVMDQFADAILAAGTTTERSAIGKRQSLVKRRAKADVKRKIRKRRNSMCRIAKKADLAHLVGESGGNGGNGGNAARRKSTGSTDGVKETEELSEGEEGMEEEEEAMEDTEEFQLALTLKRKGMERDQRMLDTKLRKMRNEKKKNDMKNAHRKIELETALVLAEANHENVVRAKEALGEARQKVATLEEQHGSLLAIMNGMTHADKEELSDRVLAVQLEVDVAASAVEAEAEANGEGMEKEALTGVWEQKKDELLQCTTALKAFEERRASLKDSVGRNNQEKESALAEVLVCAVALSEERHACEELVVILEQQNALEMAEGNTPEAAEIGSIQRRLKHIEVTLGSEEAMWKETELVL